MNSLRYQFGSRFAGGARHFPGAQVGLLVVLLVFSLPGQAQKLPAREFTPAAIKPMQATGLRTSSKPGRGDLLKRLSRVIEDLKHQGPPPAGCMEG